MAAVSKSVLRTVLACSVLAGVTTRAASAAEVEFTFQADSTPIVLDAPRRDRWGFRAWDDKSLDAARPLFGRNGLFGKHVVDKPAPAVTDSDLRAGFERISLQSPMAERTGRAGWYGQEFDGRLTATGERFDMYRLTAASADLPLNSYVSVSNTVTGETVTVRINDRRPAADGEVLTLSLAAATRLGLDEKPGSTVKLRYLGDVAPAPLGPIQVASR